MGDTNGWTEWGKHVLKELEENKDDHKEMKKLLSQIQQDLAALKVKAGAWGAVSGAVLYFILKFAGKGL